MPDEKTAEELAEEQRISDEEAAKAAETKTDDDKSEAEIRDARIAELKAIPAKDRTVQQDLALDAMLEEQKTAKAESKKQAPAKKATKKVEPEKKVEEAKPDIKVINIDKNKDKLAELGYDADDIADLKAEEIDAIVKGSVAKEDFDITQYMSDEEKEVFNSSKAKEVVAETEAEKVIREAKEKEEKDKTVVVDDEKVVIAKERDTYKSKLEIPFLKVIAEKIDAGETDPYKIIESLGLKQIPEIKAEQFINNTSGELTASVKEKMEMLIRMDSEKDYSGDALDTVVEEEMTKFEGMTSKDRNNFYKGLAESAKNIQVEKLKTYTVTKNEATEAEKTYQKELKITQDNATDFINKHLLSLVGTKIPGTFLVITKEMATNPVLKNRIYSIVGNEGVEKNKDGRITGYKAKQELITAGFASCFHTEILEADRNVTRTATKKATLAKRLNVSVESGRSETAANTTNKTMDESIAEAIEKKAARK